MCVSEGGWWAEEVIKSGESCGREVGKKRFCCAQVLAPGRCKSLGAFRNFDLTARQVRQVRLQQSSHTHNQPSSCHQATWTMKCFVWS
jgi:hypothetical protein